MRGRPPVKWINRVDEFRRQKIDRQGLACTERVPQQGQLETLVMATSYTEVGMRGQGIEYLARDVSRRALVNVCIRITVVFAASPGLHLAVSA